ncbi:MAG: hypothetical protein IKG97_03965 [Lachnospiraceae bacterium]|nr:hypothetical protein [Lachnospiraceae bacterium]
MGQYCGFCGNYLNDGEVCSCPGAQQQRMQAQSQNNGQFNEQNNGAYYDQGNGQANNQWNGQNNGQWNNDQANNQWNGQNNGQWNGQNNGQWNGQNNGQWNGQNNGGYYDPNGQWNNDQGNGQKRELKRGAKGFAKYLQRLGFLDEGVYGEGAYEKEAEIVPDCLDLADGEIPVKQYTVAKMSNRILGIPYERAVGKVQVTNKRVIFRAPGKGIAGRTCQTWEFSVDELAGVTSQKRFVPQGWALFVAILSVLVGGFLYFLLSRAFMGATRDTMLTLFGVFGFLFGFGGLVPFFMVNKHWFLKLMAQGFSLSAFIFASIMLRMGGDGANFFGSVALDLAILSLLLLIVTIFIASLRPDLVLQLKGKTAVDAIFMKRKLFRGPGAHLATYTEVLPYGNVEECIRELNAIINDVQKLGDYAVEKWKK